MTDLDRIEAAARRSDRERMAQAVERGEWDDIFLRASKGDSDAG